MSFEVAPEAYDRFMGRYSGPLAVEFANWLEVTPGQRALDVGSGPGALTAVLADRLGPASVVAVDPSAPFVAAIRERLPGVTALSASAESLPFADETFDLVVAQLVMSSTIDQFGLFGAPIHTIDLKRAGGLLLLAGGAALVAMK